MSFLLFKGTDRVASTKAKNFSGFRCGSHCRRDHSGIGKFFVLITFIERRLCKSKCIHVNCDCKDYFYHVSNVHLNSSCVKVLFNKEAKITNIDSSMGLQQDIGPYHLSHCT